MWSSMGIANKAMINHDQIFLGKAGLMIDGWSGALTNGEVNNDTQLSCTNNANPISWGKSTAAGYLYMYWHGSRPFKTPDPATCDYEITNGTQLCTVVGEGTTITDLLGKHTFYKCGNIKGSDFGNLLGSGLRLAAFVALGALLY